MSSTREHQLISDFCHQPGGLPLNFSDLLRVTEDLLALSSSSPDSQTTILAAMRKFLQEEEKVGDTRVLRCLLLLEKVLEEGVVSVNQLYSLRTSLVAWKEVNCKQISVKAGKILVILEHFKHSKD